MGEELRDFLYFEPHHLYTYIFDRKYITEIKDDAISITITTSETPRFKLPNFNAQGLTGHIQLSDVGSLEIEPYIYSEFTKKDPEISIESLFENECKEDKEKKGS